jgi:hypothetical protein
MDQEQHTLKQCGDSLNGWPPVNMEENLEMCTCGGIEPLYLVSESEPPKAKNPTFNK